MPRISQVIQDARASLKEPTRPQTPANFINDRSLFNVNEHRNIEYLSNKNKIRNKNNIDDDYISDEKTDDVYDSKEETDELHQIWISELKNMQTQLSNCLYNTNSNINIEEKSKETIEILINLHPLIVNSIMANRDATLSRKEKKYLMFLINEILTTLFYVFEIPNTLCKLNSARCVLSFFNDPLFFHKENITCQHLLLVSKIIFNISKNEGNDDIFIDLGMPEIILSIIQLHLPSLLNNNNNKLEKVSFVLMESFIYLSGSLKNISTTEELQKRLGQHGIISSISRITEKIYFMLSNKNNRDYNEIDNFEAIINSNINISSNAKRKQLSQLLIQFTGIIRFLCIDKSQHRQILSSHTLPTLCGLVPYFLLHQEFILNIVRILSKLSLYESMRSSINENINNIGYILNILNLDIYLDNINDINDNQNIININNLITNKEYNKIFTSITCAILVRAAFFLGNMTTSNKTNRKKIGIRLNGISIILKLLNQVGQAFLLLSDDILNNNIENNKKEDDDNDLKSNDDDDDNNNNNNKIEENKKLLDELADVLVKVIRLLANISTDQKVGKIISKNNDIEILQDLLDISMDFSYEELTLNIISSITNLSYYSTSNMNNNIILTQTDIFCPLLSQTLFSSNHEMIIESLRALGNFTRNDKGREILIECRGADAIILILDHSNREIAFSACGVLINLTSDIKYNNILYNNDNNGIEKLINVMRRFGISDPNLGIISGKVLFNFIVSTKGINNDDEYKKEENKNNDLIIYNSFGEDLFNLFYDTLDELLDGIDDDDEQGNEFQRIIYLLQNLLEKESDILYNENKNYK